MTENETNKKTAVIIGAGPAGLTAAYALLEKTDIIPVVLEKNDFVGGISCTRNADGNRMDMGGHRFFTKSKKVNDFWLSLMPVQNTPSKDDLLLNRPLPNIAGMDVLKQENEISPEKTDNVLLRRYRYSRIFYLKHFFDYPVALNANTVFGLGLWRMVKIGLSYMKSLVFKRKEVSLQDFMINRFGVELYQTFFKDYTEKLWGVPCHQIAADWGAQRIKGISILKVVSQMLRTLLRLKTKKGETGFIDSFLYPKFGPGQMWEVLAEKIIEKGGKILFNEDVCSVSFQNGVISNVTTKSGKNFNADYVFSTMPVQDLFDCFENIDIPDDVNSVAKGLVYRDFRTAGVLVEKLALKKTKTNIPTLNGLIHDTWIYVQEKDVKIGRVQLFNNWSPYLVEKFDKTVWLGAEYFCNEGDDLWNLSDEDFNSLAVKELEKIGFIHKTDVLKTVSFKVPKAYPAYFGTYQNFHLIKNFTDGIDNLFLIGRNGMHRYNNMDHSVLAALTAVDCLTGKADKKQLWQVNADKEYQE